MRREDLSLVVAELEVAVVRVDDGEGQHPLGPVLHRDDAADVVAVALGLRKNVYF